VARPKKKGVDSFAHSTKTTKVVQMIESKHGNNGYAFWFKLLEMLGTQEDHAYDCNKSADWAFLIAKTKVTEEQAEGILNTLAQLDAIDAELWDSKIIWSSNFVNQLKEIYRKRNSPLPARPKVNKRRCDMRLLDSFTPEQIEQIKKELIDSGTTTKSTALENIKNNFQRKHYDITGSYAFEEWSNFLLIADKAFDNYDAKIAKRPNTIPRKIREEYAEYVSKMTEMFIEYKKIGAGLFGK